MREIPCLKESWRILSQQNVMTFKRFKTGNKLDICSKDCRLHVDWKSGVTMFTNYDILKIQKAMFTVIGRNVRAGNEVSSVLHKPKRNGYFTCH